jgi:hypothetical protein
MRRSWNHTLAAVIAAGCATGALLAAGGCRSGAPETTGAGPQESAGAPPAAVRTAPAAEPTAAGPPAAGPAVAPGEGKQGAELAQDLMDQWRARHPEKGWDLATETGHRIVPPADNRGLVTGGSQGPGHSYGNVTAQDVELWEREVLRVVQQGGRIFHDPDLLGSQTAISCDMCHPDGANTHPETYPKYQVQLGRVVHLRDMVNWCIEQPIRGEVLDADDPRMRALEAYIYAQRKGVPLEYGKR